MCTCKFFWLKVWLSFGPTHDIFVGLKYRGSVRRLLAWSRRPVVGPAAQPFARVAWRPQAPMRRHRVRRPAPSAVPRPMPPLNRPSFRPKRMCAAANRPPRCQTAGPMAPARSAARGSLSRMAHHSRSWRGRTGGRSTTSLCLAVAGALRCSHPCKVLRPLKQANTSPWSRQPKAWWRRPAATAWRPRRRPMHPCRNARNGGACYAESARKRPTRRLSNADGARGGIATTAASRSIRAEDHTTYHPDDQSCRARRGTKQQKEGPGSVPHELNPRWWGPPRFSIEVCPHTKSMHSVGLLALGHKRSTDTATDFLLHRWQLKVCTGIRVRRRFGPGTSGL